MMNDVRLDDEERDILAAFESGDMKSVMTPERREELRVMARATNPKNRRINIRLSERDLELIQRRAMEEGLPYQTLITSILHKYVAGVLKDVRAE
jgi:predicted DNA binding CopG/RHH family protein